MVPVRLGQTPEVEHFLTPTQALSPPLLMYAPNGTHLQILLHKYSSITGQYRINERQEGQVSL